MDRLTTLWRRLWTGALAFLIPGVRIVVVLLAAAPILAARRVSQRRRQRRPRAGSSLPGGRGRRPRVLLIGGTINHTTQVEQIAAELPDCDVRFSWYYCDGVLEIMRRLGWLDTTALGNKLRARCLAYLQQRGLPLDLGGAAGDYDLAVTCSDLAIPANIRDRPIVLVQEGMTDPEDLVFRLVKALRLPPWLAATSSATGLSHAYDRFCVASEGYRALFIAKGVSPEKIVVTGIPNFDDCDRFRRNDFPHHGYVLVCSSDIRETARFEDRPRFIRQVMAIARDRAVIWKLHPNEDSGRARAELSQLAPAALVFDSGSAEEMIANCDVLITQFSSTAYVGLALGKEVHSYFDIHTLARLCPIQNGRTSARRIAGICRALLSRCDSAGAPAPAPAPVLPPLAEAAGTPTP